MGDILSRLRNPPFGTETSERSLMTAAANEIERLVALAKNNNDLARHNEAGRRILQLRNARLADALEYALEAIGSDDDALIGDALMQGREALANSSPTSPYPPIRG